MYGECGGSGFSANTLYRYWSADFFSGKDYNRIEKSTHGGYFLRGSGKKVQFVGSFRYSGDIIVNRGKPYSLKHRNVNHIRQILRVHGAKINTRSVII